MDPGEGLRLERVIAAAVGLHSLDLPVALAQPAPGPFGRLTLGIDRGVEVVEGAEQPAPGIDRVVGVLADSGGDGRVPDLKDQGAAGGEHAADVPAMAPDHRCGTANQLALATRLLLGRHFSTSLPRYERDANHTIRTKLEERTSAAKRRTRCSAGLGSDRRCPLGWAPAANGGAYLSIGA